MNRRDFLTLLASAPIGALAPWPQFLPVRRLRDVADQFTFDTSVFRQEQRRDRIAIRYLKEWDIDPRQSVTRIDRFVID